MRKRHQPSNRILALKSLSLLRHEAPHGFVLPMVLILGTIILSLMTAFLISSQSTRASSKVRQDSAGSVITADSAVARVLAELSTVENSALLGRNYDPINPETGANYLGEDGIVNTGDEDTAEVDQWTGFDPSTLPCYELAEIPAPNINLTGNIGADTTYRLLAYRYDAFAQIGRVLIEGNYQGQTSRLLVSLSIKPDLDNFPGVGVSQRSPNPQGTIVLRGREIIGDKANVYFVPTSSGEPTINGSAAPGDANRIPYLDAIWSSESFDGATADSIAGTVYACNPQITLPRNIQGSNEGVIDSDTTLRGENGNEPTYFQIDKIDLDNSEVLKIDTTGGPVVINIAGPADVHEERIVLRDSAQIVNIRTDGQPPRVGDARIIGNTGGAVISLYDRTCIEQVLLYSRGDELLLLTDGPGCSSGKNTNFEGVVWAEAILSSKNDASNRFVRYPLLPLPLYNSVTQGATSGIAVPDDLSSLADLLQYIDIPFRYRYGEVLSWQKV